MSPTSTFTQAPARADPAPRPEAGERAPAEWRSLYRLGGAAALMAAAVTVVSVSAFLLWPPPEGSAAEWFTLFNDSPLIGFVNLDLPFLVINVLLLPVMLALFVALRRLRPTTMLVAIALYALAASGLFASNPMVEMLSLSRQYAAASTAAEQTALLGAGEALLATYEGTAFHAYYILGQLAGVAIALVMLRTTVFGRGVAVTMLAGNAIGFGLYLPTVGLGLSVLSGVVLLAWMVLVGRRLLQLGRAGDGALAVAGAG